eukprot:scaffold34399_cov54-Cyclotella_meneghiniana.AAC.3
MDGVLNSNDQVSIGPTDLIFSSDRIKRWEWNMDTIFLTRDAWCPRRAHTIAMTIKYQWDPNKSRFLMAARDMVYGKEYVFS